MEKLVLMKSNVGVRNFDMEQIKRTPEEIVTRINEIKEEFQWHDVWIHRGDALVLEPKSQRAQEILQGKLQVLMWVLGREEVVHWKRG